MKRLMAAGIAICMLTSMWSAAAAEETSQNAQLEAVTKQVKAQLEIGSQYTNFYGQLQDDNLEPYWSLQWEAPGDQVSVDVTKDGVIHRYSRSVDADNPRYDGSFSPQLPKVTREQAQQAAQNFTRKVLRAGETVVFEDRWDGIRPMNTENFYLYGSMYYNGLPTPVSISVNVQASDLSVRYYSRDAAKRIGSIPSAVPAVSKADAAKLLKGTRELELIYTTQTINGKPLDKAVLRFVPKAADSYFVDAQTGKLINLTELMEQINRDGDSAAGGATASADSSVKEDALTEVEQQGVDLLKDVLNKEALDQKVRLVSELGLSGYTLINAGYTVNQQTKEVSCSLRYLKGSGENRVYKTATVDAKTAKLQSLYTYSLTAAEKSASAYSGEAGQKKAAAFLNKYEDDHFAQTALYNTSDFDNRIASYTFAQQSNGYPFPENQFVVGVNRADGTIEQFSQSWTDGITFDSADNLLDAEQALDAYFNAFEVNLSYLAVPVKLDPNLYPEYIKAGYSYLYEWRLGYDLAMEDYCYGVDAKSGEVLLANQQKPTGLSYSDVQMTQYPQAAALAKYGIGFLGGTLRPNKQLTQEDLVALLMSADGYTYDPAVEGALDQLYEAAYNRGLLKRADRAPEKIMNRAALVRTLVACTGYGKTADLPGIYKTSFKDAASISAADLGYIATAQGMGLVRGDEKGRFYPNDAATREQAIIVLYNFMTR